MMDRLPSLKVKLALVILTGIGVTLATVVVSWRLDFPTRVAVGAAIVLSLLAVQVVARGLTRPLREMADAADAMARGSHGRRVTVRGRDEVGRLAEAFNVMSAELEATDRLRRELVANVSHDLRTPLGALQAALENLVDGVVEPEPETLRAMHAQVVRLSRLVEQLLDLSRLEAGGVPLSEGPVDVRALLDRVRDEARLLAPAGVVVEVGAPEGLELAGDAERVQQVVMNLVENALRFSPRPGVVTVAARPEGSSVRIEVVDAGPGIPVSERERVFERFHRADTARTGDGAGLGLAIARWIVDLHGGSIRVEDGKGCRMVVELPAS